MDYQEEQFKEAIVSWIILFVVCGGLFALVIAAFLVFEELH
jgi:hypothetical protein